MTTDTAEGAGKRVEDGGPACSRCGAQATHYQGHQHLCPKHYRFGQMRAGAKRHGKAVPSHEELERMAAHGMSCWDCNRTMVWLSKEDKKLVLSLQHYRDGTLGFVCRSCNTRHAFAPGDSYREQPKDHKFCPSCKTVKPFSEYDCDRGRGLNGNKSYCRDCARVTHYRWQVTNRDYYNAKQREGRAKRKADAMLRARSEGGK